MAKRFYTVLVLPDATSTPRKFHISKGVLTALSSLAVVAIVAFAFFLYQYVNVNVRLLELKQLRLEAGDRSFVAERVGQLEGELTRLRDLDRRLRAAIGLQTADVELPLAPAAQGGAETVSRTALLDALKQRTGRLVDWVNRDLSALGQEINSRERSLRELKAFIEEKASVLAATPTILPAKGLVTAGYGYRKSPFTGQRELHEGLDIAAPYGSPIMVTADGIVTFAGPLAGYGNVVSATDIYLFVVTQSPANWYQSILNLIDITDPWGTMAAYGAITNRGQVTDKFKINYNDAVLAAISEDRSARDCAVCTRGSCAPVAARCPRSPP